MAEAESLEFVRSPEIVIGLVGAIGCDLELIKSSLKGELSNLNYTSDVIRLSYLLEEVYGGPPSKEDNGVRIARLMDQGDHFREVTAHPDGVAFLAAAAIKRSRESKNHGTARVPDGPSVDYANRPLTKHAFILHSLKTPAEVRLLRNVYGSSFVLIAAYRKKEDRLEALTTKIARSSRRITRRQGSVIAKQLIERDQRDKQKKIYGQNVQDTFAMADLFVDTADDAEMRHSVSRFLKLFFSYQFHTPSKSEYAMFHAMAAALRSADLSRQVGAAIATSDGDIVAVGCNEVPKPDGGLYWEGDENDRRDMQLKYDSSHIKKKEIIEEIWNALTNEGKQLMRGDDYSIEEFERCLEETTVRDLLEFGRMAHAEMAALMDAARRGVPVKGGYMYVTTFPCHMCARHIIAAGIKKVIYIEPYPKSKVEELYEGMVSIDGRNINGRAVIFEPFVGIAPRQYMKLFAILEEYGRKDKRSGYIIEWEDAHQTPRVHEFVASYMFIESRMVRYLKDVLARVEPKFAEERKARGWEAQSGSTKRITEWLSERSADADDLTYSGQHWFGPLVTPKLRTDPAPRRKTSGDLGRSGTAKKGG